MDSFFSAAAPARPAPGAAPRGARRPGPGLPSFQLNWVQLRRLLRTPAAPAHPLCPLSARPARRPAGPLASPLRRPAGRLAALAAAAALLSGCAAPSGEKNFDAASAMAREAVQAEPVWLTDEAARQQARQEVDALLRQPLAADGAVRIALAHSPALQAVLYDSAAASAGITQSARLPNPVFAFERLVRREDGATERDIGRSLGLSLGDLLLWPQRLRAAQPRQRQVQLQLAGEVVDAAWAARRAWVRAVAAQQALQHAQQVQTAAAASAELARRMHEAGNFSRLQQAREQVFALEAAAQLDAARHQAVAQREALVRTLGLDAAQAQALQLPERLPALPEAPLQGLDEPALMQQAMEQRLDLRLAREALDAQARSQGLARVSPLIGGLHIAGVRNSETGEPPQRGAELEIPLPLFDTGDALRTERQAQALAARHRLEQLAVDAGSQLREALHGVRTAHALALRHRDALVPLRRQIAEENLLRYNGMFIGVFELLADARGQIGSVVQAIEAERDYWLADAALQAARVGHPGAAVPALAAAAAAPSAGGEPGGH